MSRSQHGAGDPGFSFTPCLRIQNPPRPLLTNTASASRCRPAWPSPARGAEAGGSGRLRSRQEAAPGHPLPAPPRLFVSWSTGKGERGIPRVPRRSRCETPGGRPPHSLRSRRAPEGTGAGRRRPRRAQPREPREGPRPRQGAAPAFPPPRLQGKSKIRFLIYGL